MVEEAPRKQAVEAQVERQMMAVEVAPIPLTASLEVVVRQEEEEAARHCRVSWAVAVGQALALETEAEEVRDRGLVAAAARSSDP